MKGKTILKYAVWALMLAPVLGLGSCSDDDEIIDFQKEKLVSHYSIPEFMETSIGNTYELQGKGFQEDDILIFTKDIDDSATSIVAHITTVGPTYGCFVVPELKNETYDIFLARGADHSEQQYLGRTTARLTVRHDIEDKDGMNIKGMVFTNDADPVAGVWVSDGEVFAQTDANGHYWLNSKKKHGYVFICVPSGYQPEVVDALPQFWAPVSSSLTRIDQRDFKLYEEPNDDFTLLITTDYHLANRNNDVKQFKVFKNDISAFAATLPNRVYAVNLGDFSWDIWWHKNNWALPECKAQIADLPFAMYSVPGNHDNDMWIPGDFEAEAKYKIEMGPTYYSFDLGQIHFLMLDNVIYTNPTGGVDEQRIHQMRLNTDEIAWLKEDLKHVDKSTPIVVGMHGSLYIYGCNGGLNGVDTDFWAGRGLEGTETEIMSYFAGFDEVHFISGHTHNNITTPLTALGLNTKGGAKYMLEHNVAAVCGTWWWCQSYAGNNICTDGSPDGYKVFNVHGKQIEWFYKGVGLPKEKQFRTYDMNEVTKYWNNDPAVAKYLAVVPVMKKAYDWAKENDVLLNIFALDPYWKEGWTLTVKEKETGKTLTKRTLNIYDPLHPLSYEVPRVASGKDLSTTAFRTNRTAHMVVVNASSPTTTLEITLTDKFGNTSTETMTRPKVYNSKAIN